MRSAKFICLLAIIGCLSACVTPAGRADPPRPLDRGELFYGTQVSTGNCVGGEEAVPILATLVGAVIARGVDRLGAAIQSAAGKDVQTTLARRNVELSAEGFGPCIVVVRGWFHRDDPVANHSPFQPRAGSAFPLNSHDEIGAVWNLGLWVATTPDFYFQGRLIRNASATAYTIVPMQATLDTPISAHSLRGDRRSIVMSFALASGGASSISNGGATVVLGEVRPGILSRFPPARCVLGTGASPTTSACPTGPTPPANITRIVRPAFESEWFAPTLGTELKPMTLLAQVQETRDESVFWGHVAAIFTAVQQPATTALQRALVPELGADAAETATTAAETAQNAYDNALSGAVTALDACVATPADVAKRTAARVAIRNYIAAARRAEIGARLSEAHIAAITSLGSDPSACSAARALLPT
jgi:hypothetical protein